MPTNETLITPEIIDQAMTYKAYKALIESQLEAGKTTGTEQSEELTAYTELNEQRMKRVEKTVELNNTLKEKLQTIDSPWIWLVLTEGWCGDAAQNVPVLDKMAEASPNIELRLLLRTKNTDIMDQYLTNGGRSIPKLVCLDAESLQEKGTWGPRPEEFQEQAMKWKDDPDLDHEDWAEKLQKWYAEDGAQTIQADFEALIDEWK